MSDEEYNKIKKAMLEQIMKTTAAKSSFWIPGKVHDLHDNNFDQAIRETDKPILVDFWAEWCSPCKMMVPIILQLAREYSDAVYFAKINVDLNQITARQYGVMSIPNFIIFKNGGPADQRVGAVGKTGLIHLIHPYLTK